MRFLLYLIWSSKNANLYIKSFSWNTFNACNYLHYNIITIQLLQIHIVEFYRKCDFMNVNKIFPIVNNINMQTGLRHIANMRKVNSRTGLQNNAKSIFVKSLTTIPSPKIAEFQLGTLHHTYRHCNE